MFHTDVNVREWEREREGMGMSIWENNGNGNKCLAGVGMGMGMKLMGMERNGKLRAVPAQLSCVAEKETNKVRNVVANSVTFGSEFASRCSDVYTIWLLNTCLPTANPSPASLAVATCDRLTVVISTSHL